MKMQGNIVGPEELVNCLCGVQPERADNDVIRAAAEATVANAERIWVSSGAAAQDNMREAAYLFFRECVADRNARLARWTPAGATGC